MNKILVFAFHLTCISSWLAGCGNSATPMPTTSAPTGTSTAKVVTLTLSPTITVTPTASSTPELLPISPEASAYLEEALDIMQNNSLYRHSIDWEIIRKSTFEVARYAQTPADTYGAIQYALVRLGDHHSHFRTPESFTELQETTADDNPPPRAKLLLDKIGFIAIEGFNGFDGEKYATDTQHLIRELDAQDPCGWIVDLREDTGGNMWPMLAGIGPILGDGKAGSFVDSNGQEFDWSYQDGQAFAIDQVQIKVNEPVYQLKAVSPPVAVLTGVNTASSGESIVVSFRGRPNTRSFGLYTAGSSTANGVFPLRDGAVIILTTAVLADRTGQTYGDRIYPDELVEDVRQYTFLMDEAIPQPAIDWLLSQPACSGQK